MIHGVAIHIQNMSHYVIHVGIIDREIMENLAEIYRKNEYTFTDTNRVSFTIETIPQGVYKTPWAIITAWNPNNEELLKKQNDAQNLELKHALHVSGYKLIECVGGYDGHFEESF